MPTTLTLQPTGQRLTVPTSWADVTLATAIALLAPAPGEPRTAAELLLGLEAGGLNDLAAEDVGQRNSCIKWVFNAHSLLKISE